jgi:hypothetical protein
VTYACQKRINYEGDCLWDVSNPTLTDLVLGKPPKKAVNPKKCAVALKLLEVL